MRVLVMDGVKSIQTRQIAKRGPVKKPENHCLDPRLVDLGEFQGSFVLPYRVVEDAAFKDYLSSFENLQEVELDIEEAWAVEK